MPRSYYATDRKALYKRDTTQYRNDWTVLAPVSISKLLTVMLHSTYQSQLPLHHTNTSAAAVLRLRLFLRVLEFKSSATAGVTTVTTLACPTDVETCRDRGMWLKWQ